MKVTVLAALVLMSAEALGCRPLQSALFVPDQSKFLWHENARAGHAFGLPVLILDSVKLSRGKGGDGVSCSDAGRIEVALRLPDNSPYSFEELGVYLRVLNADAPWGQAYPLQPVRASGRSAVFLLAWVDDSPRHQKPLDLEMEAFVLTHNLALGSPVRFHAQSPQAN